MSTADVDTLVRSSFVIKDNFTRDDGLEYAVVYGKESRRAFRGLLASLAPVGFTASLSGSPEDATLVVTKAPPRPTATARTPVFLVLLSVVSIIATGWGVGLIYAQVSASTSMLLAGATFVLGLTAILLARYLAQRLVARRNGDLPTLHYYLPNVPFFVPLPVLYYLPTFGSITFLRSPVVDRDALFDFYFVGAIVGVAIAFLVALVGAPDAIVFGAVQSGTQNSNLPILQGVALALGGGNLNVVAPAGEVALLSPVEIAAWVGFLISFFSLMPAALLDGGRMARLALGERGSRLTTMITAFMLIAIDVPNYWVIFLLIFLLAAVQPSNGTLDSVTHLSLSRKVFFLVALLLVVLCIPIPQTFLTFPL